MARTFLRFMFQPAARGALPALFAATSPGAGAGAYSGPSRLGESRGGPAPAKVPAPAADEAVAARLRAVSEALAGATFPPVAAGGRVAGP